jgi:putative transcriptional regulator
MSDLARATGVGEMDSLQHHFLLATPGMDGGFFSRTVTYLCDHNPDGAMGLVINRPLDVSTLEIFEQLEISVSDSMRHHNVLLGGPVQMEHGFILHQGDQSWDSSIRVADDIWISTSRDILQAIAQCRGPERFVIALGYAGWGPGQLEGELARNCWLTVPASSDILFDSPTEQRLSQAAQRLGIDIDLMFSGVGHA